MINSATDYPVHSLLNHEANVIYHVPPYQREYSWQRGEWEDLFDDLIEADGSHFLGTIITLNQTLDATEANILEKVDGQQRMTTLTLLMAAAFSVLSEHSDELDDDEKTDLSNLRRMLIHPVKQEPQHPVKYEPRVRPQRQGHNLDDYRAVLTKAGLPIEAKAPNYMSLRKIDRCFNHFRKEIVDLAEDEGLSPVQAAMRVLTAAKQATIVKIEVANYADAFVLFESLNNRGMPLTPVDLIKNHLLAQSERQGVMQVDQAFERWNEMLTNLGDSSSNQDRFLRQNYNAFKSELPEVPRAPLATRSTLIRIYEALVEDNIKSFLDQIIQASRNYGRITGVNNRDDSLDLSFRQLGRIQGAPSYILLLWLLDKRAELSLNDKQLVEITDLLAAFFVRRNLTGSPQTHALARLFMGIITKIHDESDREVVEVVRDALLSVSVSDEAFREALLGSIYDANADVARFVLTTLAEDEMTKESSVDLWRRENKHYIWTIEHILPQGENLPSAWIEMLGGPTMATDVQSKHVHRLGNLTITGYNSTLSNKSFSEKMQRRDTEGRSIGYENGLSLNSDLAGKEVWRAAEIEARTEQLADRVVARFSLNRRQRVRQSGG